MAGAISKVIVGGILGSFLGEVPEVIIEEIPMEIFREVYLKIPCYSWGKFRWNSWKITEGTAEGILGEIS